MDEQLLRDNISLKQQLADAKREAAENELCAAAVVKIRKACHEIMGNNFAFVDDDFARTLLTLRDQLAAYEEVNADKNRLVRELDVMLNGEDGAAKQASLCDIVAQLAALRRQASAPLALEFVERDARIAELERQLAEARCADDPVTELKDYPRNGREQP